MGAAKQKSAHSTELLLKSLHRPSLYVIVLLQCILTYVTWWYQHIYAIM